MAQPGDLTTLANVKLYGGITGTADDAALARLVTAVSTWVANWCGRTFASQTYTETRNGDGRLALLLANAPVTAVASVTIDAVSIPAITLAGPTAAGFTFDASFLYLQGYRFSRGVQNVVLTYTAGLASTPADLEELVIELVVRRWQQWYKQGLSSQSLQGQTTAYMARDLTPDQRATLQQYRRVVTPV